jgi:acyl carrier protein
VDTGETATFYFNSGENCMSSTVEDIETGISTHQDAVSTITGIWDTILHRENVGNEDDFFDIGGNSILLIAMLEEVQNRFKKEISMENLTDGITVEKIAGLMM